MREIRLALWMRERYFCTFYDAIRTILPAAVWYSYREMWSLTGEPLPEDLSEREAAACRLLQDGPMERDDLCAALGETGGRVLSVLKKRGILQMEPQGSRKVQDRVVQIACLALEPEEALERMERKKKSAARQYDAVAFLAKYGDAVVSCATTPACPGRASGAWSGRGWCPCAARRSTASPAGTMTRRRRRSPSTMSSSGPMTRSWPSAAMAAPASPFCRESPAAARPWCISAWPRPCWPRTGP